MEILLLAVWQRNIIMLSTIWEDIDNDAEAIVLTDTKYKPTSLSNKLYEILDSRDNRRKALKQNTIHGLYSDLHLISKHRDNIMKDEILNMLVESLFKKEVATSITELDRIFLNSYCRRLLRAKLEEDYLDKDLVPGQIITEYINEETDAAIVETLRVLRVVCKFLGIRSTIEPGSFSIDKLYVPAFWHSVSAKFVKLFGEVRIEVIDEDDDIPLKSMDAMNMKDGQKKIRQGQVLMLLNTIFNSWSGSILIVDKDIVKVVPATYINRMLPKLVSLN